MYCGSIFVKSYFYLLLQHFSVVKSLRNNDSKPNKGSGVIILNRCDNVNKIADILNDISEFTRLGNVHEFDKTAIQEQRIQYQLLSFYKDHQIQKKKKTSMKRYALSHPKDHGYFGPNVPLKPILSMVGSTQNRLAKWWAGTLQLYSKHCIYDSFTLTKLIQNNSINHNNFFLCSFGISSFYTYVPFCHVVYHWEERNKEFPLTLRVWISRPPKNDC